MNANSKDLYVHGITYVNGRVKCSTIFFRKTKIEQP
jgi:hypothetical protein